MAGQFGSVFGAQESENESSKTARVIALSNSAEFMSRGLLALILMFSALSVGDGADLSEIAGAAIDHHRYFAPCSISSSPKTPKILMRAIF